ncbi:hypothetical protein H8B15_16935 [Hymenobacter sp. BT507]|uniref:Zinc-ribbon domain-containing protein n=1 Tax=Hymenobacter citatus TaxID=2763506 RepID=A0ABR7MPH2_9BACT|nr:hypothetical protein [Hymenobacter citatus]MBC6612610.1 hypothetical protein [Hymenobacter citatus]
MLTEPVTDVVCASCYTPNTLQISIFGRYAHVYWVPFFPIGKISVSECEHCRQVLEGKQMPEALKAKVAQVKAHAKIPFWHFAGLILIAVAIVVSFVFNYVNHQHTTAYVAQPQVGDVYHVRTDSAYSLLKVAAVHGNSVELLANDYQTDNLSRLNEIDKPENYAEEPFDLTPLDLQIMLQKEQIVKVERD